MATNATDRLESDESNEQSTYLTMAAKRADIDARQHEIEKDYGRAVIDDCGAWRFCLSVEEDCVVRASKAIPYDGARTFSTKETAQSRSSRRRGSQFHLTPEEVVDRYVRHSRTPHSVDDLLDDVQAARRARGVDND